MSGIPRTKQKEVFHRFIVKATIAKRRCTMVNIIDWKNKSKAGVKDRYTPRKREIK